MSDDPAARVDLVEVRRLCGEATPGPWIARQYVGHHPDDPEWGIESHALEFDDPVGVVFEGVEQGGLDALFIAASRTLIPVLVDELEQARAALARVVAIRDRMAESKTWAGQPKLVDRNFAIILTRALDDAR